MCVEITNGVALLFPQGMYETLWYWREVYGLLLVIKGKARVEIKRQIYTIARCSSKNEYLWKVHSGSADLLVDHMRNISSGPL